MTEKTWSERFNQARGSLDRTAVHEAGHIVVGLVMGNVPSDVVSFLDGKGSMLGACTRYDPPDGSSRKDNPAPSLKEPGNRSWFSRFMVCKPAGLVAEGKLIGHEPSVWEAGAEQDMHQMCGIAMELGVREVSEGMRITGAAKTLCDRIMDRPEAWELVGRFAEAIRSAPARNTDLNSLSDLMKEVSDPTEAVHTLAAACVRKLDRETMKRLVAEAMPEIEKVRQRLDIDAHGEYAL